MLRCKSRTGCRPRDSQIGAALALWPHFVVSASQKVQPILHDATHTPSGDSRYCETCGQPLPAQQAYDYGAQKKSNRIGIAVSIGLHLIGVLYYFLKPAQELHRSPPPAGGHMVYIAPLAKKLQPPKPQRRPEPPKPQPQKPAPVVAAAKPPPPSAARPKLETYVPPVVAPMQPPPEQDMSEMIAKNRARRAAANPAEPAPESDAERGLRIAKANIAAAQGGRSSGADRDDTGGVFTILSQNYHSAEVKFRGWNSNFKRNWSQHVHVEQGAELDIETAIAKQMIAVIRKEKQGDFQWDSHRLGRVVNLSARKEDEAELLAFLMKEMFPEYRRR